jgi:integrase
VAAFEFAVETGMRGGEIVALRPADAVLTRSFVHVRRSKNGDAREVALSGRARELLEAVMALRLDPVWGLTPRRKDALFRKLRAKAGIAGLNFHDSRHSAITRLAKRLQVLDLARQVGVRDLQTLLTYYNESAENRARRL